VLVAHYPNSLLRFVHLLIHFHFEVILPHLIDLQHFLDFLDYLLYLELHFKLPFIIHFLLVIIIRFLDSRILSFNLLPHYLIIELPFHPSLHLS